MIAISSNLIDQSDVVATVLWQLYSWPAKTVWIERFMHASGENGDCYCSLEQFRKVSTWMHHEGTTVVFTAPDECPARYIRILSKNDTFVYFTTGQGKLITLWCCHTAMTFYTIIRTKQRDYLFCVFWSRSTWWGTVEATLRTAKDSKLELCFVMRLIALRCGPLSSEFLKIASLQSFLLSSVPFVARAVTYILQLYVA